MLHNQTHTQQPQDDSLFTPAQWHLIKKTLRLTLRQMQIVPLLVQGLQNKQIARRLALTPTNVEMHLRRLYARTCTHDRIDLVIQVFKIVLEDERNQRNSP